MRTSYPDKSQQIIYLTERKVFLIQKIHQKVELPTEVEQEIQRREFMSERIKQLMHKTKGRLKLFTESLDAKYLIILTTRFNHNLQQLKQLRTFVDSSQRLLSVNVLNNQELLRQIKQYQFRQHLKRLVGDSAALLLDVDRDPLYQELDYEDDREPYKGDPKFILGFGHVTKIEDVRKPNIRIDDYISAKAVIKRAALPISMRYQTVTSDEIPSKVEMQIDAQDPEYEQDNFYSAVQNRMENLEKKNFYQLQTRDRDIKDKERKQDEQDMNLIKMAKEFGIDMEKDAQKNKKSKDQIYSQFRRRSQQVLQEVVEESKRKHLEMDYEFKKPRRSVFAGQRRYSLYVEEKILEWKAQKKIYKGKFNRVHQNNPTLPNSINSTQITQGSYLNLNRKVSISDRVSKHFRSQSQSDEKLMKKWNRNQTLSDSPSKVMLSKVKSLQGQIDGIVLQEKNDLELKFKTMKDDIDQMVYRVDFQEQLKNMDFGKQELVHKNIRDSKMVKKMQQRAQNRNLKIIKYSD